MLSLLVIASLINLINPTQLERDADLVIVMFDILQAHEHGLLQKKSYSQCNIQNLTNMLILRTVHQTFPVLTSATYLLAVDTKQRHLAAPWPPPGQCSCILTIIELLLGGGGAAAAAAAPHITDRVWTRLRLSTDLYRKCRRLAVCSPRSDTQPLLERIQCLQTTQFMQNYHYLQR